MFTHTYVFFQRRHSTFDWEKTADLTRYRIGGTAAYFYGTEFDAAVKAKQIDLYQAYEDKTSMKNLIQGRIDAFPMDILAGYRLIGSRFSQDRHHLLTHHPKPAATLVTAIGFSKKMDPQRARYLINAFNTGLKRLKHTHRYGQILSRHRK